MEPASLNEIERLEAHLCREFVASYITRAMGTRRAVALNPHQILFAARLSGLKISTRTLERVLGEMA